MIKSEVLGRVARAIGAQTIGQFLNVAIRLLLVPLFISSWGALEYGYWLTMTALASWLSLGDLGAHLYFVNKMTMAHSNRDTNAFEKLITTSLTFFVGVATVLLLIFAALILALPLSEWLNIKVEKQVFYFVTATMAAKIVISLPYGILLGIFRAVGAQATSVMYMNLALVIQLVASVIALLGDKGMIALAVVEFIPMLMVGSLVLIHIKWKVCPSLSLFSKKKFDVLLLREAISPSLHFLGIQSSMAIVIQGTIIVVAKTLGPIEVVIFSSLRTIANVLSQFLGIISHSAWPEITRLYSMNSRSALFQLLKSVLTSILLLGFLYSFTIALFGEELFGLWLGGKVEYSAIVLYGLSIYTLLNLVWTNGGNLLMATNQHHGFSKGQLIISTLSIFIFYHGAKHWGINGAIVGLIFGYSLPMSLFVIHLLRQSGWRDFAQLITLCLCLNLVALPMIFWKWGILLGSPIAISGLYFIHRKFQLVSE